MANPAPLEGLVCYTIFGDKQYPGTIHHHEESPARVTVSYPQPKNMPKAPRASDTGTFHFPVPSKEKQHRLIREDGTSSRVSIRFPKKAGTVPTLPIGEYNKLYAPSKASPVRNPSCCRDNT
jgi:hypothetical protein